MLKYCQHTLLGFLCALLISCHMNTPGDSFFSTQSHDNTITTAVLEAMLNDENLSTVKVHVETLNGVVTLTGYVKTIRQSDTAEDIARKTPGVVSVQNDVVVRK